MISRDGRYAITYNGEVYNFKEIRYKLEKKGYHFHSQTDSEVVLNAWAEWGEDCVFTSMACLLFQYGTSTKKHFSLFETDMV